MLSKGTKRFAIIIIVLAIIVGVFAFSGSKTPKSASTDTGSGLVTSSGTPVVPGGGVSDPTQTVDDFGTLLSTVQSINIDTTIFSDRAYLALRDNSVSLGSDIVGRNNPFAPIGVDAAAQTTGTLSIATLQPVKITSTSAEFDAQLTTGDTQPVTVIFEYGVSDTFGSSTSPLTTNHSGLTSVSVTGLSPNTTYYVRALASKGGSSPITANTMSFTTTSTIKR